jgi:tRNA(Arg) A34 adenosine deaminase TadA
MKFDELLAPNPVKVAREMSFQSNHPEQRLGAVIIKSGKIISKSFNQGDKTHTYIKRNGEHYNQTIHAELACIFKVKNKELLQGATIIVYRETKNGDLGNSRPCPMCYKLIQASGIKRIIYTTMDGLFQEGLLANSSMKVSKSHKLNQIGLS